MARRQTAPTFAIPEGADLGRLGLMIEASLLSEDLYSFAKAAWHVVEPGVDFQDNWHLQVICAHLTAVSGGEIRDLIINIPPRSMKSLLISVLWPAWEWTNKPTRKWLFASYGQSLATRDALKTRRLIQSHWYRERWGADSGWPQGFELTGDQNQKTRYENDRLGYRISTSVGGLGTGEGGDIIVCLPAWERIITGHGPMPIGQAVKQRVARVLAHGTETGITQLRPVTGWHQNPGSKLVRVQLATGVFTVTPNHRVWTQRGWVEAGQLLNTDLCASTINELDVSRGSFPTPLGSDTTDGGHLDAVASSQDLQGLVGQADGPRLGTVQLGLRLAVSRVAILLKAITNVLAPSAVLQIAGSAVHRLAISVADLLALRPWPNECLCHKLVNASMVSDHVAAQHGSGVAIGWVARHQLAWQLHGLAATLSESRQATDSAAVRDFVAWKPNAGSPRFDRVIRVADAGWADETFCLTVAHDHTLCVASTGTIISNCDDPHNVEQAESEAVRESTLTWWDETMSTRGNDPTRVARVIVMQRVHENDLTAHCLDRGGYEHLCLPMEHEVDHPTRSSTSLGFVDPRKKAGQLLWPDRFTAEALAKLKRSLGEYGTAGQLQQRPTPRGGGMFKAEFLKLFPADRPMPAMHFVIQSYDTAFTEQTTNDSTACTVWGIWEDKAGKRNMLLLDGWDEHLRYSRARARIIKDWSAKYGAKEGDHSNPGRRPDVVLVEDKGSGIAIIQELRAARVPAQKYNPGKADKVSRGEQALPIYEMGTVWIPEAKQHVTTSDVPQHVRQYASFARPFVIQLTKFGPGVSGHDDYVDTFTQTVIYCRDAGWLDVDVADEDDDVKPKAYGKKPNNPYD